jgi:small subunit ribosomal protein S7
MPRKGHIAKREVLPDPIYGSTVITRLINTVMLDGKKGTAQSIVYGALNRVADLTGKDAFEVFNLALENIMPTLEESEDKTTKFLVKFVQKEDLL